VYIENEKRMLYTTDMTNKCNEVGTERKTTPRGRATLQGRATPLDKATSLRQSNIIKTKQHH